MCYAARRLEVALPQRVRHGNEPLWDEILKVYEVGNTNDG